MQTLPWIDEVIRFWFEELRPQDWFVRSAATDETCRVRFLDLYESVSEQAARTPVATGRHALATVIVLDQFPRNMFRGSPRAFATDAQALRISEEAIAAKLDRELTPAQRTFLYMPFQHAENRDVQARSVELFASLGDAQSLSYAHKHKEVVDRFGRFPHRNEALGRDSTPEEVEFMKSHPGF
ncbi:uncharacterized protein (DUF924 family) [Povalibacter uvarum]|uniref:Uncharacterized protein (DUF924 family) n=1 Tax=Povalibacter uvarum TaxID=732238 RepID=A0A841HTX1_9GAMM|nr:DUF924 family protein [Povalibacter uvarum]MBB6095295.1 uncharacterized protein (DUF924 family) [Povalibacter uvarum]